MLLKNRAPVKRATMHRFEYRTPRFAVDLPVQFTVQNSTLFARCREISKDGMTLELMQPIPANSRGTVSVSYLNRTLELQARVAHAGEIRGGLEFIYETDAERIEVDQFIASLAGTQNRPGRVVLS
jgi:hypothetical protein